MTDTTITRLDVKLNREGGLILAFQVDGGWDSFVIGRRMSLVLARKILGALEYIENRRVENEFQSKVTVEEELVGNED